MIGYVTIGVRNLKEAIVFYDELLGLVGAKQILKRVRIKIYGTDEKGCNLGICILHNKAPQQAGNGNMVSILAGSKENTDRLDAKALQLGATDEGQPGERNPTFYGAYVRDPDGKKLCFYSSQV